MPRRIAILGDVHAQEERLDASLRLLRGEPSDLALLAGDVGADPPWMEPARTTLREAHDASLRRVLGRVREACGCPVVFVPGNHDLPDPPGDLPAANADGRRLVLDGLCLAGLGGAGPHRYGFPYEWSEREAENRLAATFENGPVDLLLSHAPPRGSGLDRTDSGAEVGSEAVRACLTQSPPRFFVCGHIHEAWGVSWLEGLPCLNAGALGEPYGQVLVWSVDWEQGPQRIRAFTMDGQGRRQVREWDCRAG
jgi:Icc-related predicted phosphoesterase